MRAIDNSIFPAAAGFNRRLLSITVGLLWLAVNLLSTGCRTVEHLDKPPTFSVAAKGTEGRHGGRVVQYVVVEKPVYIVADPLTEPDVGELNAIHAPQDEVKQNVEDGTVLPTGALARWDGVVLEYDYDSGAVYHVYGSPYRITDIELQPGELLSGEIVVGDSSRWMISSGIANSSTHVYLKPTQTNLETTLIINTNRRRYYLVIRSYDQKYMVGVRWRYPLEELHRMASSGTAAIVPANSIQTETEVKDKNSLLMGHQNFALYSFDYTLTSPKKQSVTWKPVSIYDDGEKTYLQLSDDALNYELPVLHVGKGKKKQIVNYRASGTTLIVDRLIEEAELTLGKEWLRITKEVIK